ncbi:MAG TPA: dihydroorotase [Negativicutes bacterium]|nr:dihydroorotase [Negativicutes bacterium]
MKLLLKNGRVIDPASGLDSVADVLVEGGRIVAVGVDLASEGTQTLDCSGKVIAPGLIDMHVHLRDPGLEAKEDVVSGTQAAAAGGFTMVACMANTRPAVDSSIMVEGLRARAHREGVVRVGVIGAMSKGLEGKELAEIGDMKLAGAVAISDDGHHVTQSNLFKAGLEYAAMFDCLVISHAEDEALVAGGHMHEGAVSAILGIPGRPSVAEDIAVSRDVMLAEYTGAPLHIAHVSTKGAVEIIRAAKRRGVKVTAEATPHHLTLTDEAVYGYNTATKVNPPLRSADHVAALRAGLKDGTIDVIACDHAPHAFEEKDAEYRYAPSGFAGLETSLGVILTELYHTGEFTLPEIISRMSNRPAHVLGVSGGTLAVGSAADITVIDPDKEWTVDCDKFYTRGKASPFAGRRLKGQAVMTMVEGRIVMQDGQVRA